LQIELDLGIFRKALRQQSTHEKIGDRWRETQPNLTKRLGPLRTQFGLDLLKRSKKKLPAREQYVARFCRF
jgi:hypothetical protein